MYPNKNKLKKLDVILIIIYLAISITGAVYFTVEGLTVHTGAKEVVISVNNAEYDRVALPVDTKREIVIETDFGHNTLVIEGDQVYMEHSDCNDQICVHQGEISAPKEMIVCLPNRLVIEIKGVEKQEVDQIAK
jgi:hypothetical protein